MTQYNPARDFIDDYAIGPLGWIYASALIAAFIGSVALAAAVWVSLPATASRIGAILLAIVGIMFAIDFFFPTDILGPGEAPHTAAGSAHFAAMTAGWALFAIAALLISGRPARGAYFGVWRGPLLGLAWAALIVLVILFVVMATGLPIGGFVEKVFILVRTAFVLCLGFALFSLPAGVRAQNFQ